MHLAQTIKKAMNFVKGENQIELQIEIANKIISFLKDQLKKEEFDNDLIDIEGEILKAVFTKVDAHFSDINLHLKEITPYTRLTHSELFTGGNVGLSLESELKKEILSSDKIDLLVSFIKFKAKTTICYFFSGGLNKVIKKHLLHHIKSTFLIY